LTRPAALCWYCAPARISRSRRATGAQGGQYRWPRSHRRQMRTPTPHRAHAKTRASAAGTAPAS